MRRRQAKKVFERCTVDSGDSLVPPHLRNKWVRRYYVAHLKEFDRAHTSFRSIKYYVYSKTTSQVRAVAPSQAMWENWNCGKRFIRRTDLGDGRFVSTIFLQWDHGFSGFPGYDDAPLVLFETMYFNGPRNSERQIRDTSYKDALETHEQIVRSVKEEIEAIQGTVEEITK